MSNIYSNTLGTDFSNVSSLQANGINTSGSAMPTGIPRCIQIINSSFQSTINSTDTPTNSGIRSEIVATSPTSTGVLSVFSFQMLINQSDWVNGVNNSAQISVCQLHTQDTNNFANEFSILVYNDQLWVWLPQMTPPSTGTNYNEVAVIPFQYGVWHNIVIRINLQATTAGFIELIVDNVNVWNTSSIGTAYTADAPYWKLGVYDAAHLNNFGNSRRAYFKNLNIYQGNDSYETILGTGNIPIPIPISILV